ncbi:ATP-binding protein [Chishuiella sp.]|uniref:HAMP domain-containing sensor histidine kinase n=1 Tax=Chishuiella sp. TaxID=1969467 RepID=UPI0028A98E67|nr:ATP-binding protein [Chishuiella sp.]
MKIRLRLTILFTFLAAAILFLFAFIIYNSAKKDREKEFFIILKKEAITKANLFLKAKVDAEVLHSIYSNNRETLNEVEVAIFNNHQQLLYHDAVEIDFVKETNQLLKKIQKKGYLSYYQSKWQVVGFRYTFNNNDYVITAAALDEYGYNKLNNLLKNIIIIYFLSLLLIIIAAFFFTNKAINPIKKITNRTKEISASNLDLRIEIESKGDELAELSTTINQMLSRLENSFDAQKNFVSNIAHELRTPLATVITELEYSLNKSRTKDEYQEIIRNALDDTKQIVRLSNSLLDLAKASYDPSEINFKPTRIDELIMEAISFVQNNNNSYKIELNFIQFPENENEMITIANEYLLKVAFVNLIENACKYSFDKTCFIKIDFNIENIKLEFINSGNKIPKEDLDCLFNPFYRGQNKTNIVGHGIGLYLVKKIIDLHDAHIRAKSDDKTIFTILLNKYID